MESPPPGSPTTPSSPPPAQQQPVWSGGSSSSSSEAASSPSSSSSSSPSSSSPSISTSLSSSPSSRASSGLSTPAVMTTHAAAVPPPVSPFSLPPSSIHSQSSLDSDGSSQVAVAAQIPARSPGADADPGIPAYDENGHHSRGENGRHVLEAQDTGAPELETSSPEDRKKQSVDAVAAAAPTAAADGSVKRRLVDGPGGIGKDTSSLADEASPQESTSVDVLQEEQKGKVDDLVLGGAGGSLESNGLEDARRLGTSLVDDVPPGPPDSSSSPHQAETRQGAHLATDESLSDIATPRDDEPFVFTTPKHGRRSSLGGDVLVLNVTPSSSDYSINQEVGHTTEPTGDSSYQLQAMSSAPIWNGAFAHEKSGLGLPTGDVNTPSPRPRTPRTPNTDSPRTPEQFHISSPHAEREMLRTQSMPTRSISEGYQGSLDAKYRSRTGREGHESGSTHRTPEGGDVRKKVAEKLSERKKKKLLKHIATVKLDGTVAFDVAGSTRFATELFGLDNDERQEICLNGQPVPCDKTIRRLQIVMLIVGTRGDVQPFVAIGRRLQQYGHRVRLASHANYRDFVTAAGLEYYELGGDPKILAGYMVKNKGFLPSGPSEIRTQRRQMKQICYSLLPACVDPDGAGGKPFRAEAIIANPPAYGHVHVAEALQIPIHIFFTMPWTPTSQFPHPLARLNIRSPAANRLSYQVVDMLIWWGIRGIINNFRKKKLKLKAINYLSGSQGSITNLPTGYIWSPHLVPKPSDWGPKIDVVGFCFLNQGKDYDPPDELVKWLQSGEPPIYIGFGSLPVQDPDGMTATIVKALEKTNQRGLIDRGWGGIGSKLGEDLPSSIYLIENIPHDWLFEKCAAVVHHGGAGTTAAGLRAACPTTIVPFFGDQPFWGERVYEKGVGPAPIPVDNFNFDRLVKAIEFMIQPEVKDRAVELAQGMENEQGVQGAVEAFHRHLPDMNEKSAPVALPRTFSRRLREVFNRVAGCCSSQTDR